MWWYTTGPFSFLPIHAAGVYVPEGSTSVADFVVSSYAPTLGVLLRSESRDLPLKATVVLQPEGPSRRPLVLASDELASITKHVQSDDLHVLDASEAQVTPFGVFSQLDDVSILHAVCHEHRNPRDPLDSGLILRNGQNWSLLMVQHLTQRSSTGASLAFLNTWDDITAGEISDNGFETLSLAASLLFAGFHGVVGTMW